METGNKIEPRLRVKTGHLYMEVYGSGNRVVVEMYSSREGREDGRMKAFVCLDSLATRKLIHFLEGELYFFTKTDKSGGGEEA
jgi:hypothetical protein